MTAEQVRAARTAGYAAGRSLERRVPNPYAPPHVPEWKGPRTARQRETLAQAERGPRILAAVWQRAYSEGQSAYAREHGLSSTPS